MNGSKSEEISDEAFTQLVDEILDLIETHGLETVRDAFEQAEDDTQEDLPELQDDIDSDDEDEDEDEDEEDDEEIEGERV